MSVLQSIKKKTDRLAAQLTRVMCTDYPSFRQEINRLRRMAGNAIDLGKQVEKLERRVTVSIRKTTERDARRPGLSYPEQLPITQRKDEIIAAIREHQVIIISGETGSGKTTQIPKFCLAAGRGVRGKIGCTQPRRIAAITVANRIAEELGEPLGKSVGYKIRFKESGNPDGFIKIMTDGILLAETQGDRFLNDYDTLIIDEAHERNLNIDFCLGILKTLLKRRKSLKLIITSATIDTRKFSAAFDDAPVIEVSGRTFPVDVRYFTGKDGSEDASFGELAVQAVAKIYQESQTGDILVFMPTEQDIRETCETLTGRFDNRAQVLPLFARLSAGEQGAVFKPMRKRKIIVATNVAETSLTIPGIRFVVDTGLARISRYSPRTRTTSLPVAPVSRSSADQRKGRCGRVAHGICYRLYTEDDFDSRPEYTPPEILRANLADVILRMISLRLGDPVAFPFVDSPPPKSIRDGYNLLTELGAITVKPANGRRGGQAATILTPKGRVMASIPLDPRLSAMLIESRGRGCVGEMVIIASALSVQDPRERPAEKEGAADAAHAIFNDPASDFFTLLNIWTAYQTALREKKSGNQIKKFCREHFLSYRRMREWVDIHRQIVMILREHDIDPTAVSGWQEERGRENQARARYRTVHQSILSGYLSNIALKKEKNMFRAAKERDAMVFPGSNLFNKAPNWIVASEMVETSRLFARTVAGIDPVWIESLAGDLCRRTYSNPRWERSRGEVVVTEQVSLYGLIIVQGRSVSYGGIDPDDAADIFVRRALVEGDLRFPMPFVLHNRALIEGVQDLEDRVRRRDLLVHPETLQLFYKERLPGVCDIRKLKRLIKKRGDDFLKLTEADVLQKQPDDQELAQYPDQICMGPKQFECEYSFSPGQENDGVTVKIPVSVAASVPAEAMDWMVPGLLREKITALIKGLPKGYRKRLVPVAETADAIVRELPREKGPLQTALSRFVYQRFGVDIPATAWPDDGLPEHLKMRVVLTSPGGEELAAGRSKSILQQTASHEIPSDVLTQEKKKWERVGLTSWSFLDLPESIFLGAQDETALTVYPALVPESSGVALRLFQYKPEAAANHLRGVQELYARHVFAPDIKHLKKTILLPPYVKTPATYFGGLVRLEQALTERVLEDLFAKNIRTKQGFQDHAAGVKPTIIQRGQQLVRAVIPVLETYGSVRSLLFDLGNKRLPPAVVNFLEKLRDDLVRLVPETFVRLYDETRMAHLVRYMKAMDIRARRAMDDFEKDCKKAVDVDRYEQELAGLIGDLSPHTSEDKRAALESFFWLLQEYKVSVFAQELKTAEPVSPKRITGKLKQIRRMV